MKTQKLNKTSLIMGGGLVLFIVAMLTVAISSMVLSNANAEEEAADSNATVPVPVEFTIHDSNDQPIEGVKVTYYKKGKKQEGKRETGPSDVNGLIREKVEVTLPQEYTFEAINGELSDSKDIMITSQEYTITHTFKLAAPEPVKQTVTVTANGDESVKLRHAEGWGTGDFTEAHQFTFECVNPENLTKEYSYTFQGVVIKEGDNAKCSIKDNVDLSLTEEKVVQLSDKTKFTVNVNTSPACTVNFVSDGAKIHLDEKSTKLPQDCLLATRSNSLEFKKGSAEKSAAFSVQPGYDLDYYTDSNGNVLCVNEVPLKDYLDQDNKFNINFVAKAEYSEDVNVISDKPFYMAYLDSDGVKINIEWTNESKTTQTIDQLHFGPTKPRGISLCPRFFSGLDPDALGDENSARVMLNCGNVCSVAFAYEKDENNLIPFEDMEVIEWCGPDNRTPKTISIGGATGDNSAQETAEGSAQTGDITYIAIAILACVGITSAVVAVRIRARRK